MQFQLARPSSRDRSSPPRTSLRLTSTACCTSPPSPWSVSPFRAPSCTGTTTCRARWRYSRQCGRRACRASSSPRRPRRTASPNPCRSRSMPRPDPPIPTARSKLAVDLMLTSYATAHHLAAVSLRYFNVAGAYGMVGERHVIETHLIPNVLRAVDGSGHPLNCSAPTTRPRRNRVRDYIHVADLAEAHILALESAEVGTHRMYNLGSGPGSSGPGGDRRGRAGHGASGSPRGASLPVGRPATRLPMGDSRTPSWVGRRPGRSSRWWLTRGRCTRRRGAEPESGRSS